MSECSRIVNQSMKRENAVNDECVDAIELTRTNGLQDYYRKDASEKELLQEREHFIIVKISHGEVANLECYNKVIELK